MRSPSVEECRAFLATRGDRSAGLLPLRWLDPTAARRWLLFWSAARRIDDSIESRERSARQWIEDIEVRSDQPAVLAFDSFLKDLPEGLSADRVVHDAVAAIRAMGTERELEGPSSEAEYVARVDAKTGFPVRVFLRLLCPEAASRDIQCAARPLARSIQLGDDARDRRRDADLGLWTFGREEWIGPLPAAPPSDWPTGMLSARVEKAVAYARAAESEASSLGPAAVTVVRLWMQALERAVARWDQPIAWNVQDR